MPASSMMASPHEPTHADRMTSESSTQDPHVVEPERPRKARNLPAWVAAITCLVVGFSGGMAIGTSSGDRSGTQTSASNTSKTLDEEVTLSPVSAALDSCDVDLSDLGVLVMDGGASVELNANYSLGDVSPSNVECVLAELGSPDSVYARMGRTRALDGTQTAEWGSYSASWTYHPDNGLNVIVVGGADA